MTLLTTTPFLVAATGGPEVGIFGAGDTGSKSAYTDKYTFAGDTVESGTVLGLARSYPAGISNATVGIFGGGHDGSAYSSYTDKYTYSNDVVVAGTVLGLSRYELTGISNAHGGL